VRAVHRITVPRTLHPGAWWLWALALAAAASRTTNPVPLLLIVAVTGYVVAARRTDDPWTGTYALFLKLALVVVAIRVVLQGLLSAASQGPTVLFTLPEVPLPDWLAGVKLGGDVSAEAVLAATYSGLQLGTILCCVGAANALASARRLLAHLPGALYEAGVACVVALTFAPQLVADATRIRRAHRLRGHRPGTLSGLRRTALPVLEGALDRSIELAAAMDSRGYGRTTDVDRGSRRLTGLLVGGGLLGIGVGGYGMLDGGAEQWRGLPTLVLGAAVAVAGLAVGGRRTGRTRYRPEPWALPELLVVASGLVAAVAAFVTGADDPAILTMVDPLATPPVPWLAVGGILVALAPAWLAPPPPRGAER
jgi:energy-coupling factor transport system permease protein